MPRDRGCERTINGFRLLLPLVVVVLLANKITAHLYVTETAMTNCASTMMMMMKTGYYTATARRAV